MKDNVAYLMDTIDNSPRPQSSVRSYPRAWIAVFNIWRACYDDMTWEDQRLFHDKILPLFPHSAGHTNSQVLLFFAMITDEMDILNYRVLEFGGYNGSMARDVIRMYGLVKMWHNVEISHKMPQIKMSDVYQLLVPGAFLWDLDIANDNYNVFVSSHAIEHLKHEHLEKLLRGLPKRIEYIYLEAPLKQTGNIDWNNYYGTHIYEYDFDAIDEVLSDHFKPWYSEQDKRGLIKTYKRI